jgi:DNA-binding GntR family transcriptional regulator
VKLRDKAYERFTQQLLDSRIRAGQFLSQRELVAVIDMPLGASGSSFSGWRRTG